MTDPIEDMLVKLVEAMDGVPRFHEMCSVTGISWDEIKTIIRKKANLWNVEGQQILNFVMLGAAIGHLHGSGRKLGGFEQ